MRQYIQLIGSTPAERFVDTTARDLHRLISQAATNGQVTMATISAALVARASAAIAGRRGGDQGVKAYATRVERL